MLERGRPRIPPYCILCRCCGVKTSSAITDIRMKNDVSYACNNFFSLYLGSIHVGTMVFNGVLSKDWNPLGVLRGVIWRDQLPLASERQHNHFLSLSS